MHVRFIALIAALTVAPAALPGIASAQSTEGFYKGKTLRVIVGFRAGGLTDLDARLSARFIVRNLPGRPVPVVQNVPGAGSLKAANQIYNISPKDGTELGAVQRGITMMPLFGQKGVRFDVRRFTWIGSRSGEVSLGVLWHTVPVATLADVRSRTVVVGSTGGGSDTNEMPLLMNATAGTKFKVVKGYKGGSEINIAIEKGEVEGRLGWSYNALMATKSQWVQGGQVKMIMQLGLKKHPDLPNVPLALDLALDADRLAVMKLYASRQELGFPLVAPPDLPAERVRELRAAFMAMTRDPAYLAETKRMKIEVDPRSGEDLERLIADMYRTPPQLVALAKKLMSEQGMSYK
jgi:tripartite-type tricarboxylate transporter receptor subunit TctC